MIISRSIHVAANDIIVFMAEQYSIVRMYHIFICSSVDGHLGCFHVLAIVNSAAINIEVHVSFQAIFFPGYMPRTGITESYGSSTFSFLRNFHIVPIVAVPIYIPTDSAGGYPSFHILSSICCLWIF